MPTFSQSIRDIFSGVSRLPQTQRKESHWQDLENTMVYDGRLLGQRPPTFHIAQLGSIVSPNPNVITISRGNGERYLAVIANGTIECFDAYDGSAITVYTPEGSDYLLNATSGFRWVTFGERTVITNRATTTRRGTAQSADPENVAFVVVRQGNFGTTYTIDLDGTAASYTTPESSAVGADAAISTDAIAAALRDELAPLVVGDFTTSVTGSTVIITPDGTDPYTLSTSDGLGNEGLAAIKGYVQEFSDLPEQVPDGTVLEVRGSSLTPFDNYWVRFSTDTNVWTETVAPETLLGFDTTTLPHVLEYRGTFMDATTHDGATSTTVFSNADLALTPNALVGKLCLNVTDGSQATVLSNTATTITTAALAGGGSNRFRPNDSVEVRDYGRYFVFRSGPWKNRAVGNTVTNPYPSFIGKTVKDVAVTQGRLLVLTDYTASLSRTADPFNLFRQNTTLVEPAGPIDISETLPSSAKFHAVTEWDEEVYLWTELDQYELKGEPVLTPQTVSLKRLTRYPNLSTVRPVVTGSRVFFLGVANGLPRVMELTRTGTERKLIANNLTLEIPDYITGTPILMDADDTNRVLILVTQDGTETKCWVLTYMLEDGQRVSQAWGQWTFSGPPA